MNERIFRCDRIMLMFWLNFIHANDSSETLAKGLT